MPLRENAPILREQTEEVLPGLAATNPAATLLTMADQVEINRLMMAMAEMTGRFSLYRPSYSMRVLYGERAREAPWAEDAGASYGTRPPLVSCAELRALGGMSRGAAGRRRFSRALDQVVENTGHPLEASVALLLCAARSDGGQGLRALKMASLKNGEASPVEALVLEGRAGKPPVAICCAVQEQELMGSSFECFRRQAADAGCQAVRVGAKNLSSGFEFDVWVQYLLKRAGYGYRQKTAHHREREEALRRAVSSSWV